jgi:hypothetical protein
MVDHGYTLHDGWGSRNGHCLGFNHRAYELSNEGNVFFKKILDQNLLESTEYLRRLGSREILEFTIPQRVRKGGQFETVYTTTKVGDSGYESLVIQTMASTQLHIRQITSSILDQNKYIADWTLQPLKHGGSETQERWKSRLGDKNVETGN